MGATPQRWAKASSRSTAPTVCHRSATGLLDAAPHQGLLGLRWDAVDFDRRLVSVQVELQRIEGRLQLVELKTDRSRRTIALPVMVIEALRSRRIRQLEEKLAAGPAWNDTGLVFTGSLGKPLDGTGVTRRFQRLLKKAGLPRYRFYDLRHACASMLLADGVPPRVVMEILGHSQISLTMNTYAHVMPALQREAADRMDAVLAGA